MSPYDAIARIYDPWSLSVTEDVDFYVELARETGSPVVELACGTGRIALPIAQAGIHVIGVDLSEGMLAIARERARELGVDSRVDLHLGDLREPPVAERVPLVICPFRSLLHMQDEGEKLRALQAAHSLLTPGGRLAFDVFAPGREDIEETDARWIEREPGIFERADWNEAMRTLTLTVQGGDSKATMALHWLGAPEWLALIDRAGLQMEAMYGWFDRRPYEGEEDMIFVCRRPVG